MPAVDRPARAGFTLIEVAAVLALMAILAAVATVSLKDVCRAARVQYALDQARACDQRIRANASRHGRPATLTVDLDKNSLTAISSDRVGRKVVDTTRLGRALRIDRVLLAGRRSEYGRAVIAVSDRGTTITYAARLIGADGSTHWFVFAGLTGQVTEMREDAEVGKLLEALSPPNADGG